MYSTFEILDMGLACLIEKLGVVNAEHFIATAKKENFDYTVWQREYFDRMKPGQVREETVKYAKEHPHKGNATRV